jgi:PTH1 family peptidyl-tRNA hydrolase
MCAKKDMIIILGLGNPGRAYENSRHNIGYKLISILSKEYEIPVNQRRSQAILGEGCLGDKRVILAKSRTYMNNSGKAARYLLDRYKTGPSNLLVIYDERALSFGHLRIRARGTSAGHNGVESIIQSLGSSEFPRVRIGIGQPEQEDAISFVLGEFTPDESKALNEILSRSVAAVTRLLTDSLYSAMNEYNVRPRGSEPDSIVNAP